MASKSNRQRQLERARAERRLARRAEQQRRRRQVQAAIGGAVLYAGILILLAAVVLGLSTVMAPWLSALIVGGIVTGIGATMHQRGGAKAAESTQNDEHLQRTLGAMKEAVK